MSWLANRRRGVPVKKTNPYLMTSETNPEVLAICYAQGWCASPDYMTFEEAANVTDIGTIFRETNIVHFDEFVYFGVTRLSTHAFRGCTSLESIKIGENVTSILNYVFLECTRLTTVEIFGNITSIGQQVFQNIASLTSVIIHATQPPTIYVNTFYGSNNALFYVPTNSVNDYKSANIWSDYANKIFAIPT